MDSQPRPPKTSEAESYRRAGLELTKILDGEPGRRENAQKGKAFLRGAAGDPQPEHRE